MRMFVAVDLSDEARQAIAREQSRIAAALGRAQDSLKLVRPEHLHLTLLFLGEVQEARVPAVVEAMNTAVDLTAFALAFGGTRVFPPHGAPRVLWMGVIKGAAPLTNLQSEIAERTRRLGIAFDERPFHPHLTLGRWRKSRRGRTTPLVGEGGALHRSGEIASMRVTRAIMFRSRLSSAGPTYTVLAHANLTANNEQGLGAGD